MGVVAWVLGWTAAAWGLESVTRPLLRRWPLGFRHNLLALCLGMAALATAPWTGWPLAAALALIAGPAGLGLGMWPYLQGARRRSDGWHRGGFQRPDPSRPLILVADAHWEDQLTGLEAATRRHPDADWLLLGDCFDLWVGRPGLETPAQHQLLAWADARRAAGRWVGLWLGNREFMLSRHARHFDLIGEGVGAVLDGTLAFEHGDLVNPADRPYRRLSLALRSGVMSMVVHVVPARILGPWARNLEARLRGTNGAYRHTFPLEAFQAAAEASGAPCFVTGHFHQDVVAGKGRALPWAHEGQFALWTPGHIQLLEP